LVFLVQSSENLMNPSERGSYVLATLRVGAGGARCDASHCHLREAHTVNV